MTATKERRQATRPGNVPARRMSAQRLRLTGDATSVRDARQLIAEASSAFSQEVRDAAVLLVGEIVTNAVVHGGGWFLLEVDVAPTRIRVEVTDSTPGSPRVLRMTGEREHGRGMAIVDTLASAWGTEHLGSHKVVWFEISADP